MKQQKQKSIMEHSLYTEQHILKWHENELRTVKAKNYQLSSS